MSTRTGSHESTIGGGPRLSRRAVLAGSAATAAFGVVGTRARRAAAQETVSLRVLARGDSWDPDNYYLGQIEEAVGLDLNFEMVPSADYVEKRNVVMASGDYPDAIRVSPREAVYRTYVDQGLLQPLDSYLEQFPAVRDAFTPEDWELNRDPVTGQIYHIPRITGFLPITIAYRKDWADALGIAPPTTTDEFAAMLRAFRDENPGGVEGLIPFTPNRAEAVSGLPWLGPFFSAYGADYQAWQPATEGSADLAFSSVQPGFKEALLFVRGLRDEELLDSGFLVTEDRGLFKFYAGQAGATTDWPQFMDLRLEAVRETAPDGEIAYLTGLTGPGGVGGPLQNPADQDLGSALTIGADETQADAFFRMLTWQYTDGYDLMTLGVEGITFDTVDGRKLRRGRDEILQENPSYDLYMLDRVFFAEPPSFFAYSQESPAYAQVPDEMFAYVTSVLQEVEGRKHLDYLLNIDDPVIRENEQRIDDAVVEFASRLILNDDLDADEEFTSYLERLNDLDLPAFTEAVNRLNDVPTA